MNKHPTSIRNGTRICLSIFSIRTPHAADATNRLHPYGGVTRPISRLIVMNIPKWIGSTPYATIVGSSIGANIVVAGILSTTQPIISNAIFTISRNIILLSVRLVSRFVNCPRYLCQTQVCGKSCGDTQ